MTYGLGIHVNIAQVGLPVMSCCIVTFVLPFQLCGARSLCFCYWKCLRLLLISTNTSQHFNKGNVE